MMQLAISYAKVLYELNYTLDEITEVENLLASTPALKESLISPVVMQKAKDAIIGKVFNEKIGTFLKVLNRHQHLEMMDEIFGAYRDYYDKVKRIIRAQLSYVIAPSEDELNGIKEMLGKKYNMSQVEVDLVYRPELLGGFIIQAGNWEMDWSIKGRFDELQQKLTRR